MLNVTEAEPIYLEDTCFHRPETFEEIQRLALLVLHHQQTAMLRAQRIVQLIKEGGETLGVA